MDIEKLRNLKIEEVSAEKTLSAAKFEVLRCSDELLVFDVRSEGEFEDFHVVGSHNLPLLNDDARHIVGLTYKKEGAGEAIETGWEHFKTTADALVGKAEQIISDNPGKQIVVYCARGGMRSLIVTNLLAHLGHEVFQLDGGIKAYKNHLYYLLEKDLNEYKGKLVVLEGKTGTKKTKLIEKLSIPKIDLEDLAQHRSSVYGCVNLSPRGQKMFTFLLYEHFRKIKNSKHIIVEGESKRIGNIFVHPKFYELMRKGVMVEITASMDVRIQNIIDSYFDKGVDEIIQQTHKLRKYIGKKADWLIECFESGNNEVAVKYLLEEYYDKVYKTQGREYEHSISTNDLDLAVKELEELFS